MEDNSKNKAKTDGDSNVYKEIYIKGQIYKNVFEKKDLWKNLAELYGGDFEIKQTVSKDINSLYLEIPYKKHKVVLTESDTKPLKFEIKLNLNRKFEFNITWEDSIEKILKIFGKQDIKIGDKNFDKKYIIQANESLLIKEMLNYRNISKVLFRHNIYLLTLKYDKKSKKYNLTFIKDRNTQEKEIMIELINLGFAFIDFFFEKKIIRD